MCCLMRRFLSLLEILGLRSATRAAYTAQIMINSSTGMKAVTRMYVRKLGIPRSTHSKEIVPYTSKVRTSKKAKKR